MHIKKDIKIIIIYQEGYTYLKHRHIYSRGISYQTNNRYNTISREI